MTDFADRFGGLSRTKQELLRLRLGVAAGAGLARQSIAARSSGMTVRDMQAEAVLDPEIDPMLAAPWEGGAPLSVLLTGATGFLGAFLLYELLERTAATVYCLVRAADAVQGRRRILENLEHYQLDSRHRAARIVPVAGDLARPLLGLPPQEFDRLAHQVEAIHHCGAVVKWTYPYKALRESNVDGTREILRLATRARLKPVHFVSTVGVFSSPDRGREVVLETDELETSGTLHIGYAQSKWIAEKLVRLAAARGLPSTVSRPNIAAHGGTGVFNAHDHLCRIIKGCIDLGCAPRIDMLIAGAPVDFVSRAIVHLAGGKEAPGRTFHLVNPAPIHWNSVVDWMRSFGYSIRHVEYKEWKSELKKAMVSLRGDVLSGLTPFFSESMLDKAKLPLFDCRETLAAITEAAITCPPFDERLLDLYFGFLIRSGYLPAP